MLLKPAHRSEAAAAARIVPSQAAAAGVTSRQHAKLTATDTRLITSKLESDTTSLQGNYGVAVADISSGTTYGVNANRSFRAASINKLPILISLYQLAGRGRVDLNQTLTISEEDVQHYGTGLIQDPDAARTYTIRELAALMIEASDNTAAHVLERFLGQDTIQANIDRWGLKHTSMVDNTATPADVVLLLAKLYHHDLLTAGATDIVLALLEHTVFTNRIQSGVPDSVLVAHKVGSDVGV